MADINGLFPSKWIKSPDLGGKRVTLKMSHVKVEEVGDKKKLPVLYFQGATKGLVLNVTNANMISEITGTGETNDWHGRAVTLYVTKVEYGGKRVDGIRIDYPEKKVAVLPTAPRPAPPVVAAPMTALGDVAHEFLTSDDESEPIDAGADDGDVPF